MNHRGQPVSDDDQVMSELSAFLGTLKRSVPLTYKSWFDVPSSLKGTLWNYVKVICKLSWILLKYMKLVTKVAWLFFLMFDLYLSNGILFRMNVNIGFWSQFVTLGGGTRVVLKRHIIRLMKLMKRGLKIGRTKFHLRISEYSWCIGEMKKFRYNFKFYHRIFFPFYSFKSGR